jgi:hypothetical protein
MAALLDVSVVAAGQVMITKEKHRIRCFSFTEGKTFAIIKRCQLRYRASRTCARTQACQ